MIKRIINIDKYWKVIVYYNIDYNFFYAIKKDLRRIDCSNYQIETIYNKMITHSAKAVTISNVDLYTSVVLFNKHYDINDYINSIVHESEHIKQSILYAYNIKDKGEKPAYTIGYIAMKIMEILV